MFTQLPTVAQDVWQTIENVNTQYIIAERSLVMTMQQLQFNGFNVIRDSNGLLRIATAQEMVDTGDCQNRQIETLLQAILAKLEVRDAQF